MTALDDDIIDRAFLRLAAIYGNRFTNQWPGRSADEIKNEWAQALREFAGKSAAIDYALDHLPSVTPPTVLELRDVARTYIRAHTVTAKERNAPVTPEERERALAILATFRRPEREDRHAWARRLRLRELAGERLTRYQRDAWREALGTSGNEADSPSASTT